MEIWNKLVRVLRRAKDILSGEKRAVKKLERFEKETRDKANRFKARVYLKIMESPWEYESGSTVFEKKETPLGKFVIWNKSGSWVLDWVRSNKGESQSHRRLASNLGSREEAIQRFSRILEETFDAAKVMAGAQQGSSEVFIKFDLLIPVEPEVLKISLAGVTN